MVAFRYRKQKVTRWTTSPDGYGGHNYGAPSTLMGRWEDRSDLIKTPSGQEVVSRAVVYLGEDIEVGDYLYNGCSDEVDPSQLLNAFRVIQFIKTPDLRNLNFIRQAIL